MALALFALLLLETATAQTSRFGAYFPDWAQYRPFPYTQTPTQVAPIINRLDEILYSFIYFCPPAGTNPMPYWAVPPYASCTAATQYQLIFVDSKDPQFISQFNAYKAQNPNLKLIASVGGWNFPSNYFSQMVSTAQNRQTFIQSAGAMMKQYGFDGIDIDWEFPCSPARENSVEITCTDWQYVYDAGGNCPADTTNLPQLLSDMRSAWGSQYLISIASQAAKQNEVTENITACAQYVDWFHIMTYDYAISDDTTSVASVMSPNSPLNTPPPPAVQMSINQTVMDYLSQGVPASKMMIGMPYYGHTWYQPGMINTNNWKMFGNTGVVEGLCCGPLMGTYGGKPGQGSSLCGTMMYSEILFASPAYYYDTQTQTAIGFWNSTGSDNYTPGGIWLSYNDVTSVTTITNYAKALGLRGVFVYDTSMDSVTSSGQWTYVLSNQIANTLGGH